MAVTRYSTNVTLCEDTSQNFELYDLLRQADPNYAATDPSKLSLYVFDGTKYVETTTGYFTAVDKDTFTVDMAQMPNFNGVLNALLPQRIADKGLVGDLHHVAQHLQVAD